MARKPKPPAYSLHKPSGKAVVKLKVDGTRKSIYLGDYGSDDSRVAYARVVADFLAGRPITRPAPAGRSGEPVAPPAITVGELAAKFEAHAKVYYVKGGKVTSETHIIHRAMEFLTAHHADLPADKFGIGDLDVVRAAIVDSGMARPTVNKYIDRIRRCFSWGAVKQFYPPAVALGLKVLPGLKAGRSKAPESPPIEPVDRAVVNATLPHLPGPVADMVRLQLLAGLRPSEVCTIRPADVDRSGDGVWVYTVQDNKCAHHGKVRRAYLGPEAQKVLAPYLLRMPEEFCFRPARVSTTPRVKRRYRVDSYRRAIVRACEKAGVEAWAPNRLRHLAGTEFRRQFGIEVTAVLLGHSNLRTSEIYAQSNDVAGIAAMKQIG